MENVKQFVIDYIEGRITTIEFLNVAWKDDSVFTWLQSFVPEGKVGYYNFVTLPNGITTYETAPYDIKREIYEYWNALGRSRSGKELNIHGTITRLFQQAFPNEQIKVDKTIENKFDFLLAACPEYIGGSEVEESGILEKLMEELPTGISKTERIKIFKKKLKEIFHVEGQKYPRWLQPAEWPFSNGKPMKFLYQKSFFKDELRKYYFEDVDTKEQRVVEQFT